MASGLLGRVAAYRAATRALTHHKHTPQHPRAAAVVHEVASPHSRPPTSCAIRRCVLPCRSATPSQRVMLPQPQSTREEDREQTNWCTRTSVRTQNRHGRRRSHQGARALRASCTARTLSVFNTQDSFWRSCTALGSHSVFAVDPAARTGSLRAGWRCWYTRPDAHAS